MELNDLLRALSASPGSELRLEPEKPPQLASGGTTDQIDPAPIRSHQISTMVFPLIPQDVRSILPDRTSVEFVHNSALGSFNFSVTKSPAGFIVSVAAEGAGTDAVKVMQSSVPEIEYELAASHSAFAAPQPAIEFESPQFIVEEKWTPPESPEAPPSFADAGANEFIFETGTSDIVENYNDTSVPEMPPMLDSSVFETFGEPAALDVQFETDPLLERAGPDINEVTDSVPVFAEALQEVLLEDAVSAPMIGSTTHTAAALPADLGAVAATSAGLVLLLGKKDSGCADTFTRLLGAAAQKRGTRIHLLASSAENEYLSHDGPVVRTAVAAGEIAEAIAKAAKSGAEVIFVDDLPGTEDVAAAAAAAAQGVAVFGVMYEADADAALAKILSGKNVFLRSTLSKQLACIIEHTVSGDAMRAYKVTEITPQMRNDIRG